MSWCYRRSLGVVTLAVAVFNCDAAVVQKATPVVEHVANTVPLVTLSIPESSDVVMLGQTGDDNLQTVGDGKPQPVAAFIARLNAAGKVLYFRYLNGLLRPFDGAVSAGGGFVWVLCAPDYGHLIEPTYKLAPEYSRSQWFLTQINLSDGHILSITSFPELWSSSPGRASGRRMAIDSLGQVWVGGWASVPIPVTPDAFEPDARFPVSSRNPEYPGSLLRFSGDGSAISYATYLGDGRDAVASLVVDSVDNVYAVGTRIWKLSNDGRLLWSTKLTGTAALSASLRPHEVEDLYVAGCTTALNPPVFTTAGSFQEMTENQEFYNDRFPYYYPQSCQDGFVARFDPEGALRYSTLVSGPGPDSLDFISAQPDGSAIFSGRLEFAPSKTKDVYLSAQSSYQHLGHLNPEGTAVSYLTPVNISWGPRVVQGDTVLMTATAYRFNVAAGVPDQGIQLIELHEVPAILPRIDRVDAVGSFDQGYNITILGEELGLDSTVTLDGIDLPTVGGSATDRTLAVRLAVVPAAQADAFAQDSVWATYTLKVHRRDGVESRPVMVWLQYRSTSIP